MVHVQLRDASGLSSSKTSSRFSQVFLLIPFFARCFQHGLIYTFATFAWASVWNIWSLLRPWEERNVARLCPSTSCASLVLQHVISQSMVERIRWFWIFLGGNNWVMVSESSSFKWSLTVGNWSWIFIQILVTWNRHGIEELDKIGWTIYEKSTGRAKKIRENSSDETAFRTFSDPEQF